jgi:hypothetical protein
VGSCEAPIQVEGKVGWLIHNIDSFLCSSDPVTEEKVTHRIDQDRAKADTCKGKGKECSSSQSESSSVVGGIISTQAVKHLIW